MVVGAVTELFLLGNVCVTSLSLCEGPIQGRPRALPGARARLHGLYVGTHSRQSHGTLEVRLIPHLGSAEY